jgi:glycosyl-4,4'-diaponeurosporenoate acyltransferase
MRLFRWSDPVTVAVDIVAWGIVHAGSGYLVHRLPDSLFARDRRWSHSLRFERSTVFYEGVLHIKRWKDRVPEAGALFPGGRSKRALPGRSAEALHVFAIETRRAELGHWLAALASPIFVLWNPPRAAALMIVYGCGINLPFIAIQRYNRVRVARIVARYSRRATERSSD